MEFGNRNIVSRCNEFFNANPDKELALLESASASIADLSFNEFSIHYLKTSNFQPDFPYMDLEELILSASWGFYEQHIRISGVS